MQILLGAVGAVATAAGTHDVLRGVAGVRGRSSQRVDPSHDSEHRFYSAWYALAGIQMLRAARQPQREATTIRLMSAGWVAAALGRALSMRTVGRPHPLYSSLMVAELAIPTLLLRWLRAIEGDARNPRAA